jgi:hypothetical protein
MKISFGMPKPSSKEGCFPRRDGTYRNDYDEARHQDATVSVRKNAYPISTSPPFPRSLTTEAGSALSHST